jgi:hypothetical protein
MMSEHRAFVPAAIRVPAEIRDLNDTLETLPGKIQIAIDTGANDEASALVLQQRDVEEKLATLQNPTLPQSA